MPRKSLAQRAEQVTQLLVGRDLSALPKYITREVALLEKALGLDAGVFLGYSARTRRRYTAGAKAGRTAKQTREREAAVARERKERKRAAVPTSAPRSVQSDPRWQRVLYLRDELRIEGINVTAGPNTAVDRIAAHDLFSDESLVQHVTVYGYPYVLDRMEHQLRAIQQYNQSGGMNRSVGRDEMMRQFGTRASRDFAASRDKFLDDDERWYWYHASQLHWGGLSAEPFGGHPGN